MVIYNDFTPFEKITWGASDTETFTYIDGVKVSNDDLKTLGRTKPQSFFRKHASVRVWAWQFSDGEHFFVTNDFDEYTAFLCEHKIKSIWFYNAKFDFAQIDYKLLTHTPAFARRTDEHGKGDGFTFESLHNDKGGRFSLKIWLPYKARGKGSRNVDRHSRVHSFTFYDFCNIFGGGLSRLLNFVSVNVICVLSVTVSVPFTFTLYPLAFSTAFQARTPFSTFTFSAAGSFSATEIPSRYRYILASDLSLLVKQNFGAYKAAKFFSQTRKCPRLGVAVFGR